MHHHANDEAAEASAFPTWLAAATAQRDQARHVGRMIADTLTAQFPGAAYLTLQVQEDTPRDWELFPDTVRDGSGAVLFAFDTALPQLGPEHAELARQWGKLDPSNAFALRAVLRQLYIAGAVYDQLPEELDDSGDDNEVLCLLLSVQARPREWQHEGPDHWDVEARRLRPYSAADRQSGGYAAADAASDGRAGARQGAAPI